MHKIIPTQLDKLFDNYILIAQRLERSVCPSFENMMMHLDAMVHFRCVLNERLLENGPDSLLQGFEVQRNESVRLEGYLSVFNGFIITYRFFVICTNIYSN